MQKNLYFPAGHIKWTYPLAEWEYHLPHPIRTVKDSTLDCSLPKEQDSGPFFSQIWKDVTSRVHQSWEKILWWVKLKLFLRWQPTSSLEERNIPKSRTSMLWALARRLLCHTNYPIHLFYSFYLLSPYRRWFNPDDRGVNLGFRVARAP